MDSGLRQCLASSCVTIALAGVSAGAAYAQAYPGKPIRVVTSEAGGGNDFAARLVAQEAAAGLGQPLIVENRPAGVIPGEVVSRAAPDGYTILFNGSSFWIGTLMQKAPYDTLRDFAPISLANHAPNILVVHPSLPVRSVKDLIALAKARPGELDYGTGPTGGSSHLAPELFKAMAGIKMVRIPYKGNAPALNALLGGQVQLVFAVAAAVTPHTRSGRLRALAVTSSQPSVLAPGLPTVAASALPGYESETIVAIFAPAKTPVPIIQRLNDEIVRALNKPDVKEKFLKTGVEVVASSPDQLASSMKGDMVRLGKVIKDAGISIE